MSSGKASPQNFLDTAHWLRSSPPEDERNISANVKLSKYDGEILQCSNTSYSCNRDEDLHEKARQSMLYVFVLHFQEILGTLLEKDTYTKIIQDLH